jgi:hypothetical protein
VGLAEFENAFTERCRVAAGVACHRHDRWAAEARLGEVQAELLACSRAARQRRKFEKRRPNHRKSRMHWCRSQKYESLKRSYLKLVATPPHTSAQPSTMTKSNSFTGSETTGGDNIIIPRAVM